MARYLSQEWLDLQKELAQDFPLQAGASARMQYVVTNTPDGDVRYFTTIEEGRMTENAAGRSDDAEFTLTSTYDDSKRMLQGDLDATAAFMQGRVKVTGDMGKLMALMPFTQSPEYKAIQSQVADQTEF